jgi:glycosyltransferase involved in cell wall biosynthesis
MRILIGSISYYPNLSGVAISTHLLAKHLVAKGHEVTIVTSNFGMRTTIQYDKTSGITTYRLRSFPNPVRKGFFIPFLPYKEVSDVLQTVKPDVIHLQDPLRMSRCIREVAAAEHIPVVVSNHFNLDYILLYFPKPFHPLVRPILSNRVTSFYNLCDAITCPTETVAHLLRAMGVTQPLYALSNGVDIHRFYSFTSLAPLRARYRLPSIPLVLYVGRLDKEKCLTTLLRSIPEVISKTPAHFVLAGVGKSFKSLKRLVKKLGIEHHVTFTGAIPHSDDNLVALYQAATIFAMPSDCETQSIVTMEAMAAGKPVVAANGGALPELVKDGENGLLFKPKNSFDLSQKLITLLKDPARCREMSEKSLEFIAKHELSSSLSLYEQVYKTVYKPFPNTPRLDHADSLL